MNNNGYSNNNHGDNIINNDNDNNNLTFLIPLHCLKSVRIRSFSGLYFLAFEMNTEIYRVNLRTQSKYENIWTRKTPNTDTFHAVLDVFFNIMLERI